MVLQLQRELWLWSGYGQGSGGGNKNCVRYCIKNMNTSGNTGNYGSGNPVGGNYHGNINDPCPIHVGT
jgi:hypothetical protein